MKANRNRFLKRRTVHPKNEPKPEPTAIVVVAVAVAVVVVVVASSVGNLNAGTRELCRFLKIKKEPEKRGTKNGFLGNGKKFEELKNKK